MQGWMIKGGQRALLLGLVSAWALTARAEDLGFTQCLQQLSQQAPKAGVSSAAFNRITAGLEADPSVLPLLDSQPEFTTPVADYLAALVDAQRIADGRAQQQQRQSFLTQLQRERHVDPATVLAVWGVESDYGRITGKRPLLQSLATLSCAGRRQSFFRGELLALLKLIDRGDLSADGLTGSWAGAFGQTQFMPSTYARIAVDGDGDGRRDLVASTEDALASTAHYLQRAGWPEGEPWGIEVQLPQGFDPANSGRKLRRPVSSWRAAGLRAANGGPLQIAGIGEDAAAAVLLPAGVKGPAFLVFRNYHAIRSYNASDSYALAIALLSDQLRGAPGLVKAWPGDDPALDRAGRRELQQLLLDHGHPIGAVDGLIGDSSRRAIRAEQQKRGIQPADGRPGQKILKALRESAAAAPAQATLPAYIPARHGSAFTLPSAYPQFQQSPIVIQNMNLPDVPGLSAGDFHGFPSLLVKTPYSSAAISLFGGHLLSFVPEGQQDVMWLSPLAADPPTPIRGGTPVCWPYFGKQDQTGKLPSHGFVRTLPWQLQQAKRDADGSIELVLAPPVLEDLGLQLQMVLKIGRTLEQQLITVNTSSAPINFTQALHNYFHVGDALKVDVQGLDGLEYLDKFEHYASRRRQQGLWNLRDPRDPGRSDRIYTEAAGDYRLLDPVLGRSIHLTTEGSRSLVAWNPGEKAGSAMADVGPGWHDYVCLEAANAGPDVIELAAGGRHVLKQTIAVEPL